MAREDSPPGAPVLTVCELPVTDGESSRQQDTYRPLAARVAPLLADSGQRAEAEGFEPPDPCGTLAFKL